VVEEAVAVIMLHRPRAAQVVQMAVVQVALLVPHHTLVEAEAEEAGAALNATELIMLLPVAELVEVVLMKVQLIM